MFHLNHYVSLETYSAGRITACGINMYYILQCIRIIYDMLVFPANQRISRQMILLFLNFLFRVPNTKFQVKEIIFLRR